MMPASDRLDALGRSAGDLPPDIAKRELDLPVAEGMTLLGRAAQEGDLERISGLIKRGANVNRSDLYGQPPLVIAARSGKSEAGRALILAGADVNDSDGSGRTSLMYALYRGDLDLARLLVANGARGDTEDADGRAVLHYARHYMKGKNSRAAVEIARDAGGEVSGAPARIAPIRSDVDFVTLETLRNLRFRSIVKNALLLAGVFLLIEIVTLSVPDGSYFLAVFPEGTWARGFIQGLARATPTILPYGVDVEGPKAFLVGTAWLVPLLLIVRPIALKTTRAREARIDVPAPESKVQWLHLLQRSDELVRGISGLLRMAGRRAFRGFRDDIQQIGGIAESTIPFAVLLLCLTPYAAGPVQSLLFGAGKTWLLSGKPHQPWGASELAIWVVAFVVAFIMLLAIVRGIALQLLVDHMVAKQRWRSERMAARVEELVPGSTGPLAGARFVLFLGPFDHGDTMKIGKHNFVTSLTYAMSEIAEVVVVGRESGRPGPTNLDTASTDWRALVESLAKRASLIVLIPAPTPGVQWEVEMLLRTQSIQKTVFVAPPASTELVDSVRSQWQLMRKKGIFQGLEIPEWVPTGFLFSLDADGLLNDWDVLGFELEPPPLGAEPFSQSILDGPATTRTRQHTTSDGTMVDDVVTDGIVTDDAALADTQDEEVAAIANSHDMHVFDYHFDFDFDHHGHDD